MGGDGVKWFADPYEEAVDSDPELPSWVTEDTQDMPLVDPWRPDPTPQTRMTNNRGHRFRPGFGRRI